MLKPRFQAYLALACYKTDHYDQAKKIINHITSITNQPATGDPDYFAGWYYSGIGMVDSAFFWLEKAYKNRSIQLAWLKVDPVFKNLKADKRYLDLYEKTGHKAYDDYTNSVKNN